MRPGTPYIYVQKTLNLAAAGTTSVTFQTDGGLGFAVEKLGVEAVLNVAFGAAIAGTPLQHEGSTLIANNTMPTLAHVFANVSGNVDKWTDGEVPITMLCGSAKRPSIRITQPTIPPAGSVRWDLRNGGPAALDVYITMEGHFVDPQDLPAR